MAAGGLAAVWELAVVFLLRPLLAVAFVLTLILLSPPPSSPSTFRALASWVLGCLIRFFSTGWYVAWRTVLVHVPLVQEIVGLRRKKPVQPKPPNRRRIARFYQSQAEAAQRNSNTS